MRARARALGALVVLTGACSAQDTTPVATELVVSRADGPSGTPRCMVPRGVWRLRYAVSDPGTSCALLLRDGEHDFDAPAEETSDTARCTSAREGPDEACRFEEMRRCTGTLAGSRYDSVVWLSFAVLGDGKLDGRGIASGGSALLGVCQTTFTLTGAPTR